MIISMVAAMAKNRVIGKDNQMPWHLPADLKHFKAITLHKPVVMGRKTFESIGRPLPGRRNVVISRHSKPEIDGVEWVAGLPQAFELLGNCQEVMIIGGGEVYKQCLPLAQRLYLTEIDLVVEGDAFFPDYRQNADWQLVDEQLYAADQQNQHALRFIVLQRLFPQIETT